MSCRRSRTQKDGNALAIWRSMGLVYALPNIRGPELQQVGLHSRHEAAAGLTNSLRQHRLAQQESQGKFPQRLGQFGQGDAVAQEFFHQSFLFGVGDGDGKGRMGDVDHRQFNAVARECIENTRAFVDFGTELGIRNCACGRPYVSDEAQRMRMRELALLSHRKLVRELDLKLRRACFPCSGARRHGRHREGPRA